MSKIIFFNTLIFLVLIILVEIIFGYWFSQHNFGYHMRGKRLVTYKIESTFENIDYNFIYRRNFYGFRMDEDINPSKISIIFEGGSTGDETPLPEELTIVGNLNKFLKNEDINLFVGNASLNGKSTKGYINDFLYWFPKLNELKPLAAIFYSGINDSSVYTKSIQIENKTFENTFFYKIKSYLVNNSFILNKIKKIKDIYFDLDREKIIYDLNKKNLYDNFEFLDYENAKNLYKNINLTSENEIKLNFYKSNLEQLKSILIDQNIIPIFVTQIKHDGLGDKNLYLINEETKRFAQENNYYIIKLDELYIPSVGDFFDPIHTTPKGSKKMADIIYKKLLLISQELI